jgi:hypothetical protein
MHSYILLPDFSLRDTYSYCPKVWFGFGLQLVRLNWRPQLRVEPRLFQAVFTKEMRDNFSNTFKVWIEVILIGSAGFSSVRRSFNARYKLKLTWIVFTIRVSFPFSGVCILIHSTGLIENRIHGNGISCWYVCLRTKTYCLWCDLVEPFEAISWQRKVSYLYLFFILELPCKFISYWI